jgi:hypothetical protein
MTRDEAARSKATHEIADRQQASGPGGQQARNGIQLGGEQDEIFAPRVNRLDGGLPFRARRCGSAFAESVEPVLLMKAEIALNWAKASYRAVEFFTTTI